MRKALHTRTQAINQFCKDCTYDIDKAGTWREQVEGCVVTHCALHPFRPVSMATIEIRKKEKYRVMDDAQKAAYRVKQARSREVLANTKSKKQRSQ